MGQRRTAQPMHPESSGPGKAPAEIDPRADQEARQSQGQNSTASRSRIIRQHESDPQQPQAAQIAEGQPAAAELQADWPVRLPALKGQPSEQKERLEGHSPRKGTATAQ